MIDAGRLNLEKLAETLLWESECVILPGLGGLIRRDNEASINPATHVVRPKSKSFFFNPTIHQTDGMMANYLTEKFGISYPDAVKLIDTEVSNLKSEIAAGNKIKWDSLGEFFGSADKTFFIPKTEINFDRETYGLVPIQLKPIAQATEVKPIKVETVPVVEQEKAIEEPAIQYKETALKPELDQPVPLAAEKNNYRFVRWIAAAAVIGTILFFGIRNEHKTRVTQEAAVINLDLADEATIETTAPDYPTENLPEENLDDKELNLETVPEESTDASWENEENSNESFAENTKTIEEVPAETINSTEQEQMPVQEEMVESSNVEKSTDLVAEESTDAVTYSSNLSHQYHIVVSKTVVKANADQLLENDQLYYLAISNSFVHRVGIASSDQIEELENILQNIKAAYPKAEIINTKAYEKL